MRPRTKAQAAGGQHQVRGCGAALGQRLQLQLQPTHPEVPPAPGLRLTGQLRHRGKAARGPRNETEYRWLGDMAR